MNLSQYYLDLEKVNSLDKEMANKIHEYYRDMIYCYEDGRKNISSSLFNTLYQNGYLKNIRDEKITEILDGNNNINS
jgi:hypothetical protein